MIPFSVQKPLHFDFVYQVLSPLMQMTKTVYLLAGEVRRGSHQILILWILSQSVRHFHRIHRWSDDRMIYRVCN